MYMFIIGKWERDIGFCFHKLPFYRIIVIQDEISQQLTIFPSVIIYISIWVFLY